MLSKLPTLSKATTQAVLKKETNWFTVWCCVLRCLAAAGIVIYVWWQTFWLSQGQLPPALLLALTGLPAPTTGGTRSIVCLLQGDWNASLKYNAMVIPMSLLTIACVAWPTAQFYLRRPIRLPRGTGLSWVIILALAWSIKVIQFAIE